VLVIDYAMPQMNGLAFCQAVQDLPCKKILFTGQADEKIAIDAFNRGLIDRFIKKSDHDALDRLELEIRNLQKEFFHAQSLTLKDLLSRHSFTFLSDPALETLVEQLCKRHGFVEYYLFPNPTGILFFDMHGKATLMVVETEASLMSQLEVAQDYGAPLELLTGLRELRLVPFFSDSGGMYTDALRHDWLSYCLPAQICFGAQDYYWALFDFPSHYLREPFYSLADFLRDQSADIKS
jgi:CheY-like chemotaxis protein